jgi:hypothetical protein
VQQRGRTRSANPYFACLVNTQCVNKRTGCTSSELEATETSGVVVVCFDLCGYAGVSCILCLKLNNADCLIAVNRSICIRKTKRIVDRQPIIGSA